MTSRRPQGFSQADFPGSFHYIHQHDAENPQRTDDYGNKGKRAENHEHAGDALGENPADFAEVFSRNGSVLSLEDFLASATASWAFPGRALM